MAGQGYVGYCHEKELLFQRLCVAARRYCDSACQLAQLVGQHPEFSETEANAHEHGQLVRSIRAAYNEHKREHGCYLITICAWCKRIRNSEGVWRQSRAALQSHGQAKFSHGICPACAEGSYNAYRYGTTRVDKTGVSIRSGKFTPAA